jgi:hypothetical protein
MRPTSSQHRVFSGRSYQCVTCGFDGALGHYLVAIEAAHVSWHSQQAPDEMANALALCALHHALFGLVLQRHFVILPKSLWRYGYAKVITMRTIAAGPDCLAATTVQAPAR